MPLFFKQFILYLPWYSMIQKLKELMLQNSELYHVSYLTAHEREYTLVSAVLAASSAVATLGDTDPSSLSTDEAGEPPPSPCSSEAVADGAGDLLPLELLANTLPSASARKTVRAVVSTDVGDPSSWSRRDCVRRDGRSRCFSTGTFFLAAPSTLRGYGCAGFLLGRGGGIWITGAAPPAVLLPVADDSLTTCSTAPRFRHQKRRGKAPSP